MLNNRFLELAIFILHIKVNIVQVTVGLIAYAFKFTCCFGFTWVGTTLCTAFAVRKLNRIKTVLLVLPKGSKLRCRCLIFIHGEMLKKNISFRFLFTDMKVEGNDFTGR